MKPALLLICLAVFQFCYAHPGIAIVKDSKGNIYYSDLKNIYRISKGKTMVVVSNVHSHELYMDAQDNLYGEHEFNDASGNFFHYLWKLDPQGNLDTLVDPRLAYVFMDYSLARDAMGNEYYTKRFVKDSNTAHIYKRNPEGREIVFAKGNFRHVSWLHPQQDGHLYYVHENDVYRVDKEGRSFLLAWDIASTQPSFSFSSGPTVWGIWEDSQSNVYIAVFSDQLVKKITPEGNVRVFYHSDGNWAPNQGVFDENGTMWLLESNDKNEMRVIQVPPTQIKSSSRIRLGWYVLGVMVFMGLVLMIVRVRG